MAAHSEKHFTSSQFISDIIIGMSDGLTVPFALAAGLSGAGAHNSIVITAGIAELVAGSISMGLGGFLAGKTEQEHYATELQREYDEVEKVPETEKEEVKEVFAEYGISRKLQDEIAEELCKDKKLWVDFMMRFELGMEKPDERRATKSALTIGLSYLIGGIVPLISYFFTDTPLAGLKWSVIITLLFLFLFGYVKTKFTGQSPFKGALKTVLIGVIAAFAAYYIAKLI
ncbi:iron transporter [Arachidicoccus ginsenosidimutans]|uniref:VIT1/CCC1 transporter family protein n=1 Tax=Arachidicoccus sp. BS20 TaxID=1850526 RepID=UPI0007F0824A|nr:VIT1/CCC1 transporter family protein [Arachidicoccus sp. BS20]ANI89343.1 iron transporter [Arachidicoccus sp. BS20]